MANEEIENLIDDPTHISEPPGSCGDKIDLDDVQHKALQGLYKYLPHSFRFEIVESDNTNLPCFKCILRTETSTDTEALLWLDEFQILTKTQWGLRNSIKANRKFCFSRDYICHHSAYKKVESSKKSKGCRASLSFRIKNDSKYVRYRDPHMKKGLPGIIRINNNHNHVLENAEDWKWLRRTDHTVEKFLDYFRLGKCPAEAKHFHEERLKAEGIDQLSNSSINPPEKWIYWLHSKWRKETMANSTPTTSFLIDQALEQQYQTADGDDSNTAVSAMDHVCSYNSELVQNQFEKIQKMLTLNTNDNDLMKAAKNFTLQLKRINSPTQLYQFMMAVMQDTGHLDALNHQSLEAIQKCQM